MIEAPSRPRRSSQSGDSEPGDSAPAGASRGLHASRCTGTGPWAHRWRIGAAREPTRSQQAEARGVTGWVVVGIVLAFVVEATAVTGYALWLAGVFWCCPGLGGFWSTTWPIDASGCRAACGLLSTSRAV